MQVIKHVFVKNVVTHALDLVVQMLNAVLLIIHLFAHALKDILVIHSVIVIRNRHLHVRLKYNK